MICEHVPEYKDGIIIKDGGHQAVYLPSVWEELPDKEMFLKYNGMECCECGCCSYICPAKRNLTQSIKTMRKDILADRKRGK